MAAEMSGDHQGFVPTYVVNVEVFDRLSDFRGKVTTFNRSGDLDYL